MSWEENDFIAEGNLVAPSMPARQVRVSPLFETLDNQIRDEFRRAGFIEISPENLTPGRQYTVLRQLPDGQLVREENWVFVRVSRNFGTSYVFRKQVDATSTSDTSFNPDQSVYFEAPGQRGGRRRGRKATKRRKTRKSRKASRKCSRKGRK